MVRGGFKGLVLREFEFQWKCSAKFVTVGGVVLVKRVTPISAWCDQFYFNFKYNLYYCNMFYIKKIIIDMVCGEGASGPVRRQWSKTICPNMQGGGGWSTDDPTPPYPTANPNCIAEREGKTSPKTKTKASKRCFLIWCLHSKIRVSMYKLCFVKTPDQINIFLVGSTTFRFFFFFLGQTFSQ